jgi:putative SOS response-associated peptidase YedK
MCTRFVLKSPSKALTPLFKVEKGVEWEPSYNVAPSQRIPAVIRTLENKKRVMKLLQWGFVASWNQGGRLLVNVESENIAEKPILEESFEKWRCLIPVDGFYAWRHQAKETRPFYFQMKDKKPFALAGLWAPQKVDDKIIEVCAILTTTPNEEVRVVHDRMPVIVEPKNYDLWMDSEDIRDFKEINKLFKPYPGDLMEGFQVGPWVNKVTTNDPKCIEPSNELEAPSTEFE